MKLSIKTPKGKYRYEFIPLFVGTKIIDKEISTRNIKEFKRILNEAGVEFILSYGTLLGAVRENDFISHDEDIDLSMSHKDLPLLLSSLFLLREHGFEVCRYDRRGLISFIKDNEYIDVYIFKNMTEDILICGREVMPAHFLQSTTSLIFKDEEFRVPKDYVKYLEFFYGNNWKTPVQFYHYELPKWKRNLNVIIQHIKEFLPDKIFYALVEPGDRRYREPLLRKINEQYTK